MPVTKLLAALLVSVSFATSGPTPDAAPTVTGVLRVGAKLTCEARQLDRARHDRLRVPVVALRRERRALQLDPRRHPRQLLETPADAGHTLALTVRASDATGTAAGYAPLGRARRRPARADRRDRAAGALRPGDRRSDADRRAAGVERGGRRARLPLAAL